MDPSVADEDEEASSADLQVDKGMPDGSDVVSSRVELAMATTASCGCFGDVEVDGELALLVDERAW